jgi:C1A family cysteine protease
LVWGTNQNGEIGLGAHTEACTHPTLLDSIKTKNISQIAVGSCFAFGISQSLTNKVSEPSLLNSQLEVHSEVHLDPISEDANETNLSEAFCSEERLIPEKESINNTGQKIPEVEVQMVPQPTEPTKKVTKRVIVKKKQNKDKDSSFSFSEAELAFKAIIEQKER